jgi:hypothetical protein
MSFYKKWEKCVSCYFLSIDKKSSIGFAGLLIICTVPREPNSIETRVIASLLGGFNNVDKIIPAEDSVLLKDFSAKSFDFLVNLLYSFRSFLNGFSTFRGKGLQKNVDGHNHPNVLCMRLYYSFLAAKLSRVFCEQSTRNSLSASLI